MSSWRWKYMRSIQHWIHLRYGPEPVCFPSLEFFSAVVSSARDHAECQDSNPDLFIRATVKVTQLDVPNGHSSRLKTAKLLHV